MKAGSREERDRKRGMSKEGGRMTVYSDTLGASRVIRPLFPPLLCHGATVPLGRHY